MEQSDTHFLLTVEPFEEYPIAVMFPIRVVSSSLSARFFITGLFLIGSLSDAESRVLHVGQDGDGSDGQSWVSAFQVIGAAILASSSGDQIWVKRGTYYEDFDLKSGISIYGGFSGIEQLEEFEVRDPLANPVIIDGTGLSNSVIRGSSIKHTHVEGLTVQHGSALHGGGAYLEDSTVTFLNCIFHKNIATEPSFAWGGGIYGDRSQVELGSCTVVANMGYVGSGIAIKDGTLTIGSSEIVGNHGRFDSVSAGSGIYCTRSRLLVANTVFRENLDAGQGGGLYLSRVNGCIENSWISENEASAGGGLYTQITTDLLIHNTCFHNNRAGGVLEGGGGILANGSVSIRDCTFTANRATNNGGGIKSGGGGTIISNCLVDGNIAGVSGGGIVIDAFGNNSDSPSVIQECVIRRNRANLGGGIDAAKRNLSIEKCIIQSNESTDFKTGGGGIHLRVGGLVSECILQFNRAENVGGGVKDFGGMFYYNTLITHNSADIDGGGVHTDLEGSTFINCTVVNNFAPVGQDIAALITNNLASRSEPKLTNCIVRGDSLENSFVIGENVEPVVSYSNISGGWPGEGNIDEEPGFVNLVARDYRLRANSPCIDAGSTAGPITDLDGNHRPIDVLGIGREGSDAYDMGAFEFQLTPHPLRGDINRDGWVNAIDLLLLRREWNP